MADPPKSKSPERELAEVLVADLQRRERRTARDLLLSEQRALRRFRIATRRANDSVVATAASSDDERQTLQHVHRAAATLQTELQIAARYSLGDARATGRAALEREAGRELPAIAVAAQDDAAAAAIGQTLAGGWASTALSEIATRGDTGLARVVAGVPQILDPRLRRTAATDVARSFNDERNELLVELGEFLRLDGDEPADPNGPASKPVVGLYKVRSEILDRVTCQDCFAADGETVEAHESFKSGEPPVHPYCRGIVEHIIVPKPERLEDISIDYAALKAEIQDVIRERREISDRHALRFTSDSLGTKRSAEVLTRRFRDEAYATNEPTAGAGRVKLIRPRGTP